MTQPLFYFLLGVGASILALCLLGIYLEFTDKDQKTEEVEAEPILFRRRHCSSKLPPRQASRQRSLFVRPNPTFETASKVLKSHRKEGGVAFSTTANK